MTRYEFERDGNGRIIREFGDGFTEKFAYDPAKNVAGVALQGPRLDASVSKLFDWSSTPGGVVQLARGPNGETIALMHDVCGRVIERRVDRKGFRPKIWHYGWDAHDRLVRCDNPRARTGSTATTRSAGGSQRALRARAGVDGAEAHRAGACGSEGGYEDMDLAGAAKRDGFTGETRPPIVGTYFLWHGDVVAVESPMRLDGQVAWADATHWHYEPGCFRPLAKQTADDTLLLIANDHLGTPRDMLDEAGDLAWSANYATWGMVISHQTQLELRAGFDCLVM